jgi:hypothetical protein
VVDPAADEPAHRHVVLAIAAQASRRRPSSPVVLPSANPALAGRNVAAITARAACFSGS